MGGTHSRDEASKYATIGRKLESDVVKYDFTKDGIEDLSIVHTDALSKEKSFSDKYKMGKFIAKGAFGYVYRCALKDEATFEYAVKVFRKTTGKVKGSTADWVNHIDRGKGRRVVEYKFARRYLPYSEAAFYIGGKVLPYAKRPAIDTGSSFDESEKDHLTRCQNMVLEMRHEVDVLKKLATEKGTGTLFCLHNDDVYESKQMLYVITPRFIMELMDAMEMIKSHSADVQHLFNGILQGLEFIHTLKPAKLAHLDLKPGNIMITNPGSRDVDRWKGWRPILIDFGLSAWLVQPTYVIDTDAGTPSYMPPEQWRGKDVGTPADIWAIGVTFYRMVVGDKPFKSNDGGNAISKGLNQSYDKILDKLDKTEKDIILRMLVLDPAKRATATELLADDYFKKDFSPKGSQTGTTLTMSAAGYARDDQPIGGGDWSSDGEDSESSTDSEGEDAGGDSDSGRGRGRGRDRKHKPEDNGLEDRRRRRERRAQRRGRRELPEDMRRARRYQRHLRRASPERHARPCTIREHRHRHWKMMQHPVFQEHEKLVYENHHLKSKMREVQQLVRRVERLAFDV